jgi:hypothetical protein
LFLGFGAQAQQQPQQQQTSIFGSTNVTGTPSLFGTQQNTGFGGVNVAKPAGFGFGQQQQQQQPTSLFGQTQQQNTSLFGTQMSAQTNPTGTTSLFGSKA